MSTEESFSSDEESLSTESSDVESEATVDDDEDTVVDDEDSETSIDDDGSIRLFVIGDPHFSVKYFEQCEELARNCLEKCAHYSPSAIVLLGDILDTHETAKNAPFKLACDFIEKLSTIAHTFVLMGNHDFANPTEFLSDDHFFGPYKGRDNITIVDTPTQAFIGTTKFIFCPFVPNGRFTEALDKLCSADKTWVDARCIFSHQEFFGCVTDSMGSGALSSKADKWREESPLVISGHIHKSQWVGKNVFYTGSSRQVAINEAPNKRVWLLTFDEDDESGSDRDVKMTQIDLGLKERREIEILIDDINDFDFSLTTKFYVDLKVIGTTEQFRSFRKSGTFSRLKKCGVRIMLIAAVDDGEDDAVGEVMKNIPREHHSFDHILREIVKRKSELIQDAHRSLFGAQSTFFPGEKTTVDVIDDLDSGEENNSGEENSDGDDSGDEDDSTEGEDDTGEEIDISFNNDTEDDESENSE